MRRHPKASAVGSTLGTGSRRARFGRAFATRDVSGDAKGSGASAGRSPALPMIILGAMLLALILPGSAGAAIVHPFKEAFGSAVQPSFTEPQALAVDPDSGNLLVVDAGAQTLSRFKPNGEPAPFSALGTHVIDAKKGIEEKPCGEEPASCDETPQNGFSFDTGAESAAQVQVAVDNSGNPLTDGNIYVTQGLLGFVDIFGPDGHYIGQIDSFEGARNEFQELEIENASGGSYKLRFNGEETTPLASNANAGLVQAALRALPAIGAEGVTVTGTGGSSLLRRREITFGGALENQVVPQIECVSSLTGTSPSCLVTTLTEGGPAILPTEQTCGVAVDSTGKTFVGGFGTGTHVFSPTTNPPTVADNTANFEPGFGCALAAGAGPTSGSLFFAKWSFGPPEPVVKMDAATGETKYTFAPGANTLVTVNPSDGHVLAASGNVVTEYDASGPTSATEASTLTAPSAVQGVAVNPTTGNVYISRSGGSGIEVFGTPVSTPTVTASAAIDVTATKATVNGAVDAEGTEVTECVFEYGPTTAYGFTRPCAEPVPSDSSSHPVSANLSGLAPSTTYHYRLVAKNAAGPGESTDRTFATDSQALTKPATAVTAATATLNGSVNPAGLALTDCHFEYILLADYEGNGDSYSGPNPALTKACSPAAGSIESDFLPHAVSAAVGGLAQNSAYRFRLVVTSSAGTVQAESLDFTTLGGPQIAREFANPVGSSSATLRAEINPSGSATSYHFEWGAGAAYGNRAPAEFDPILTAGTEPVKVTAQLTGLSPATAYHFRVVATNASGTTTGSDWSFVTLDALGAPVLPSGRTYELVSPPDKGAQGSVRLQIPGMGWFQVAEDGDSVAFPLLGGLEDTDSGGDATYLAKRSASGWQSTKVSPPSLVPNPKTASGGGASAGVVTYYSPDLSCGVVNTFNPLTEDTPVADVELGVYNLYVRHQDGTHTLITNAVPANPEVDMVGPGSNGGNGGYQTKVVGASPDCSRVYFQTPYRYLPNATGLYEWDEGTLRDAGRLPDGTLAAAPPVGPGRIKGTSGAVSRDGSRLFFTAPSNGPGTVGNGAVFVRDNGSTVTEVSRKQGGANDSLGSRYEIASPDGSHVFFLASYGLTPSSSAGPLESCDVFVDADTSQACDLYDYEVESGELRNLSAVVNPADTKGAVAKGVIAVSDDGESVYFAARGQLVPGKGGTYAENLSGAGSANVYLARDGQLTYVTTVASADLSGVPGGGAMLVNNARWVAEATPDGEHLLFESRRDLTSYESGGVSEAFLFSVEDEALVCISCRPDGLPPVDTDFYLAVKPLIRGHSEEGTVNPSSQVYKMSEDGTRAFFTMPDVLAPGAVSGNANIYEWNQGEVRLLLTGPLEGTGLAEVTTELFGISRSGEDVFVRTPLRLSPYDVDFAFDLYDVRVGGGFAPPPVPPVPCNPAADECQGTPTVASGAPSAPSADFNGPGNPALGGTKPPKCPKGKVRKHGKCVKKPGSKKQKGKARSKRAANNNHGGAK